MPRKIEITLPSDDTDRLIADLQKLDGVMNLQVQKGSSISPPGDVVSASVTTTALPPFMQVLDRYGLGTKQGLSLSTSEPDSLVIPSYSYQIDRDGSIATWEEMEMIISKDSNVNTMVVLLLICSGILAALGIATNAIHVVIGAMLVAPGFMPLMRINLGLLGSNSSIIKRGIQDFFLAYLVLIAAATATAFVMKISGTDPLPGKPDYYQLEKSLFAYWTTITATSVVISLAAALAGSVMIVIKRSIFTSGVMIALALVPSAALIGMSLVMGDVAAAGQAALRWLVDIALILVVSFVVFGIVKKSRLKRAIAM